MGDDFHKPDFLKPNDEVGILPPLLLPEDYATDSEALAAWVADRDGAFLYSKRFDGEFVPIHKTGVHKEIADLVISVLERRGWRRN